MRRRAIVPTGPAGWLIAALLAGCGAPAAPDVCQVAGELGAGAFTAHDCRHQDGCLDGWRFAARSVETLIFCPAAGQQVTEVVSDDASVTVAREPVVIGRDQVAFDLQAGEPGTATIEVRGPGLVERLTLTVEEIAGLDIDGPAHVVEGGRAAITSTKTGVSGAPLFGRGGYGLSLPAGLSAEPATTATLDCGRLQPDVVITGDAVGAHPVATDSPALPWSSTIEVVPVAAVTAVELTGTRILGSADRGYSAYVRVIGRDAAARPILGVECAWTSPRPVLIASNVCWSLVLMETGEPLDLTCSYQGRVVGSVRLTSTLVL